MKISFNLEKIKKETATQFTSDMAAFSAVVRAVEYLQTHNKHHTVKETGILNDIKNILDNATIQTENQPQEEINREHEEKQATIFTNAIKKIAAKPDNMDNLHGYLSKHFTKWLKRYANTPEQLAAEMEAFAEMEI